MPITETDYDAFVKKMDQILDRFPSLLTDKDRFLSLSQDQSFVSENNRLYDKIPKFYSFAEQEQCNINPSDLDQLLREVETFVSEWETRPILSYFFEDPFAEMDDADVKMMLEEQYTDWGSFETIKVFPWTTKSEIEQQYDEIFKGKRRWDLRPIALKFIENFKIQALKDAGWRWKEIRGYLFNSHQCGDEYFKEIEERERALKAEGKTEVEIDAILEREFPMNEYD